MRSSFTSVVCLLALCASCTPVDRKLGELSIAAEDDAVADASEPSPDVGSGGLDHRLYSGLWGNDFGQLWVAGTAELPGDPGEGFVATVEGEQVTVAHRSGRSLRAIAGCDADTIHAVGRVMVTNAGGWTNARVPDGANSFSDVWAATCERVVAVGKSGAVAWLERDEWQLRPAAAEVDLNGVWGTDESNVYAVGSGGIVLHFDGEEWNTMKSGTAVDLLDVWGAGPREIYAVGGSEPGGGYVVLEFDGNAWRVALEGNGHPLFAVHGDGAGRVLGVGGSIEDAASSLVQRRAGEWVETSFDAGALLWDVWVPRSGFATAVGARGTVVRFEPRFATNAVLPTGIVACAEGEEPLIGLPVVEDVSCVDVTAPVAVACASGDLSLSGSYRCVRHVPSGARFMTRVADPELDGKLWRDCSLPPDVGSCSQLQCDRPEFSNYCTPAAFCLQHPCGVGAFDANGCQRPICVDDRDCAAGAVCREVDVPLYDLCAQDTFGDCTCMGSGSHVKEKYCVPTP